MDRITSAPAKGAPQRKERLVDEREAAEVLGLKVATLRRWRWAGSALPFIRIGRAIRYSPSDLQAFIEAGRRRSTSESGNVT